MASEDEICEAVNEIAFSTKADVYCDDVDCRVGTTYLDLVSSNSVITPELAVAILAMIAKAKEITGELVKAALLFNSIYFGDITADDLSEDGDSGMSENNKLLRTTALRA